MGAVSQFFKRVLYGLILGAASGALAGIILGIVLGLVIGAILGIVLAIPLALVAAVVLGLIAGASEGAVEAVANMLKQAKTAIQNLINFGFGLLEGEQKRGLTESSPHSIRGYTGYIEHVNGSPPENPWEGSVIGENLPKILVTPNTSVDT
ncbi:hypothetical protein INS49_001118 [Diaporthe citri]|uniref:uncharacterized protein n=1 Tax=Diaporthe citri TaxID=83186 RepID=UPI001C81E70A|nr:uncharacterized protein INS49_001118 [Diaporthe citri]KAG6366937.1 hypothetical protein INS49_001118 [Diaporthe citri]